MILSSEERIREYTEKGWWTTVTFDDLFKRNVLRSPNKPAVADPLNRASITDGAPRQLTFAELEDEVNRLAAVLIENNIQKDDVVAVQLPNSVEIVAAFLAIMRVGAVVSPLPVQYREYELEQLLNRLEAKAFITMSRIRGRENAKIIASMKPNVPSLETVLAWGENVPDEAVQLDLENISYSRIALNEQLEARKPTANDIFTICWTSGTEGAPKGVPRSQNEWYCSAYASIDLTELNESDVIMNPFPMVNMAGIAGLFVPWLLTGCRLVQHHPFDLQVFLEQIETERVTYSMAAPAILTMLLKDEELLAGTDVSSLRRLGSGSAPLSPWMIRMWHEKYGIHVINFFGSNEGTSFSSGHIEMPDYEKRAHFFPRYGVKDYTWISRTAQRIETKLVNLQTGEVIVEPGVPGELRIRGASVFSGYWKDDILTRKSFDEDGYYCTGDLLEIVGPGEDYKFYRMVGRSKDIIIRGGMNISPLELEGLIQSHPKVAEVSVIGMADEVLGEKVCACIVSKAGQDVTIEELSAFLRDKKIASYKLPEHLRIMTELPRNPVGKILKHHLREAMTV
ncbi:class I adenylate-forming enzyme family protein [Sporosarcina sp. P1]|uniref:class I adenylate-forming enzyme family protein n=1 Tax=Sporosarcina sp. P1 TaxID=2048257 RepID=UPI000C165873|nr:class I adenylate-forming enzyme family protein [Sporosarcina sp. P1]PIC82998.1 hypothetical protein CSV73_09745 [Sporosarcina sp. P1]